MHKTIAEAIAFVEQLKPLVANMHEVDVVVCPSFTCLSAMQERLHGTSIELGAQNAYWEMQGAYTGEISPLMLKELCSFVIVGHSERRAYFRETDEVVNKKLVALYTQGLRPILCVGESLEQREAGETRSFVSNQVEAALVGLSAEQLESMVIAYEPIWAIGTGKAATPEDAAKVINDTIRKALAGLYGVEAADSMRVLYGGSVKPNNAASFFDVEGIDGALVGGASLEAQSFSAIVEAAV
jgi:triosephosphate isomerase